MYFLKLDICIDFMFENYSNQSNFVSASSQIVEICFVVLLWIFFFYYSYI